MVLLHKDIFYLLHKDHTSVEYELTTFLFMHKPSFISSPPVSSCVL